MIRLAIWYLRRKKVSVIMNMDVEGGTIKQMARYGYTYNNKLANVRLLDKDGQELKIPQGKFKVQYDDSSDIER